ncbi:hypothetical protein FSP39_000179 [Pinctada imbricata]|uniref:C-type lectin domain-containing protein n=1 Tax=Pinctada imbricata TaxID=66713 RepID=A0AA88Y1T9_PINIB|nr:hypothetical protein FSP39_000179 [Pinctada imbricata]
MLLLMKEKLVMRNLKSSSLSYSQAFKWPFASKDRSITKYATIYIGASDIVHEGDHRWEDDSPVVYDDFYNQQPNNYDQGYPTKQADCVVFGEQWDDVYCGRSYPFICQKT